MIRTKKLRRWFKRNTTHAHEKFAKSLPYDLKNHYTRTAMVNYACSVTNAKSYLEIGCKKNVTFDTIPVLHKVGVDREMGGTIRMTSDEFFAQNKETFDVIFIDGLHTYEQVHRDISNALNALNKGGMIVLDDMLPLNWVQGSTTHLATGWIGNCWKCNFEITATKGLDYRLVLCGSGTGVIKPKPNHDPLADLSNELNEKLFSYLYENHAKIPTAEVKDAMQWMKNA